MRSAAAVFACWYALSAAPTSAQDLLPGIADLIAIDELKVGMLARDVPPMIITGKDGMAGGFDARIAEAIAGTLGVRLSIVRTAQTFNAVVEEVARGDVDIAVSYLTRTPTRALKVLFTRPYLYQNQTLLLSRTFAAKTGGGCPSAETFLETVEVTPVGILDETAYVDRILHAQPNAKLVRFDEFDEMMQAVRTGAIPQSFQGQISVHHYFADHPDMRVFAQLCDFPGWQDNISIAVNGRRPELVSFLNVFLEHVTISLDEDRADLTIDPWYNE